MSGSIFKMVQDFTTKSAEALTKVVEGLATSTSHNGLIGFSFKDSSGNYVLPQLDASGRLGVTQNVGTPSNIFGFHAGSPLGTPVDIANLTLTATKEYSDLEVLISCNEGARMQLIQDNNSVETVLAEYILDAGQYTFKGFLDHVNITAGATGTQELLIRGENLGNGTGQQGRMTASVSALEIA